MATGFTGLGSSSKREDRTPPEVRQVPVNRIVFSPFQARKHFADEALAELAQSIREQGVLQPVLLRPFNKGFELIAGQRRVMASKIAGVDSIPAIIIEMDDRDAAAASLVENLQREDLNPLEEAEGYRRLLDEFGLTQDGLAQRVGKSQPNVANKLRLLRLPEDVKDAISREIITERHARAILAIKDEARLVKAFEAIVERRMSVQQTEDYVGHVVAEEKDPGQKKPVKGRRLQVVRDLRIFLNGFRQAVKAVKKAGIDASIEEVDEGDRIRITVTVSKNRPESKSEKKPVTQPKRS